jgi:predicted metalloenzyme YecM
MKQEDLNNYFSTVWRSNLNQYKYSGWNLVDKVMPYETVLDVGCGFNEFRQRMPNLIGIDPANDLADVKVRIEDYKPTNKFDVAFCLGSINFGGGANIISQINCVVRCLKPQARIYWRCNPGLADHGNEACKNIDFYPWTIEKHVELADLFGFRLTVARWDTANRIYAEWFR